MIVEDALRWLVEWVGVAGVPVGIVVGLVAAAYHGHHVLKIGATVASGFRAALVVAVLLALLVATPAVEVDLGAALQLADVASDVVRYLSGIPEVIT